MIWPFLSWVKLLRAQVELLLPDHVSPWNQLIGIILFCVFYGRIILCSRPVLGLINYFYGSWLDDPDDLQYQGTIYTTLHEIGHALGFTPGLFDNFIDPITQQKLTDPVMYDELFMIKILISYRTKEINGVSTDILTIEPLRTRLRNYFSCPTLDGGYLENQGSPGSIGSHFERRIFLNEVITPPSPSQLISLSQ